MSAAKYQVYRGKGGDWRWRLRACNSRIIGQGEGYTRRQDAIRGALGHQRTAAIAVLVLL